MPVNPLADALRRGRFCYVVELVASALRREAQLLDAAARLARLPDVVAGSITRYARAGTGGRLVRVAVAGRPVKSGEAGWLWECLKLGAKIGAGAGCAITQGGWDARKPGGLRRYLEDRGLRTPLLGNVYVLGPRAAERMAKGEPPGCWVSPALLETVRRESQGKDGGLRARLERAARTVAVLRGLGYAGAYIGGTHDADHVAWIIRRAQELAPGWEALSAELDHGVEGGFYLPPDASGRARVALTTAPTSGPTPLRPTPGQGRVVSRLAPPLLGFLGRLFPVTRETWLRRGLRRLAA